MKKVTSGVLIIFILLSFSISAYANLGPAYWQGYPSYNALVMDEHSPIAVEKEDLVFDFSKYKGREYTITGSGNATYVMKNTSNEVKSVQMAFPYISSAQGLKNDTPVIKCDGEEIPYDVYYGQDVTFETTTDGSQEGEVEFKNIDVSISDKPYSAVNFRDDEKAKLYQIDVDTLSARGITYEVSFTYNSDKTKVIVNGFDGSRWEAGRVNVSKWCNGKENFEILVLGEDITIEKSGFPSNNSKVYTENCIENITNSEIDIKDYLSDKIQNFSSLNNLNPKFKNQSYNLFVRTLDLLLTQNNGFTRISDMESGYRTKRVISLLCNVDFQPDSTKEISVSFNMEGTMDKRETMSPKYNFVYFLNPAKNWKYFKNLNVKVKTSENTPYIVKSNMDLIKENKFLYTAHFDSLPEKDMTFTMCSDLIMSKIPKSFVFSGILIIIILLFVFSLWLLFLPFKKKKARKSL